MENLTNPSLNDDTENLSEFEEWMQNGVNKAEEMIKDTAEK